MADKDLDAIIPLMPRSATYIFTSPATPRALPAQDILDRFLSSRPSEASGEIPIVIPSVADAVKKALEIATKDSIIYIGGSTFVVSEALPLFT